jgi:hypothetical protein
MSSIENLAENPVSVSVLFEPRFDGRRSVCEVVREGLLAARHSTAFRCRHLHGNRRKTFLCVLEHLRTRKRTALCIPELLSVRNRKVLGDRELMVLFRGNPSSRRESLALSFRILTPPERSL